MIKLIVWLILIAMALRGLIRLLQGVAEGLKGPAAPKPPSAVPLVRDPVCGTYVVPSSGLSVGSGAGTKFFCSEKCRSAYAGERVAVDAGVRARISR